MSSLSNAKHSTDSDDVACHLGRSMLTQALGLYRKVAEAWLFWM